VKNTHFLDSSEGEGGKPGAWKVDLNEKTLAGLGPILFFAWKNRRRKNAKKKGKIKNAFTLSLSLSSHRTHSLTGKGFHQ
jgi:hypothetical protein